MTIVYDASRLVLRFGWPAPNGIDRVDLTCAKHFISQSEPSQAVILTLIGPRLVPGAAAHHVIEQLEAYWGEGSNTSTDAVWEALRRALLDKGLKSTALKIQSHQSFPLGRVVTAAKNAPLFGRAGLFPGRNPVRAIPKGAVYLNVSQFPARLPGIWRWLERRPDIRSAFLIHDLLPISHPEFFPPTERDQHSRFLRIAARLGRVLIVTSDATREQLAAHLSAEGLGKPRIEIAPLSVDPSFATEPRVELALRKQPYFVVCGTIEPRKNLLLLLNVWRELSHELGAGTPKLVIVGTRGWHNENVVDMLERCPAIAPHIIEVSGLSTPALKRLLDNCRAVLMPTFAEGFGLPVAEALTAGVPVICSEMPVLATIHGGSVTRLDPLDGLGWLRIIRMTIDQPPHSTRSLTIGRSNNDRVMCFSSHIDRILRSLMK